MATRPQPTRAERLAALGCQPEDFEERFLRSAGPGGQNVNKVSTAVWLVHVPSGTGVKAMTHRTQAANREEAWDRLVERLEQDRATEAQRARDAAELARRQARRKPRHVRRQMVASKRHQAGLRAARRIED